MTNRPRYQNSPRERRIHAVTAFARQPCQITHARATRWWGYTSRPWRRTRTLDRGVLAKIDRRIFSELDHAGGVQLAKIPLSEAV